MDHCSLRRPLRELPLSDSRRRSRLPPAPPHGLQSLQLTRRRRRVALTSTRRRRTLARSARDKALLPPGATGRCQEAGNRRAAWGRGGVSGAGANARPSDFAVTISKHHVLAACAEGTRACHDDGFRAVRRPAGADLSKAVSGSSTGSSNFQGVAAKPVQNECFRTDFARVCWGLREPRPARPDL